MERVYIQYVYEKNCIIYFKSCTLKCKYFKTMFLFIFTELLIMV